VTLAVERVREAVGIDAARTARRLGAEVRIIYRRIEAEMPARPEEVEEARRETERCRACGDYKLGRYGGICPVTICAKGLLNGPCGGASLGKCEAGNNKDCTWELIYQRLKQQGRLDNLKTFAAPLDYKLQAHPIRVVKEC
jgi:hypothetical protein